jgi:hypothetical protein
MFPATKADSFPLGQAEARIQRAVGATATAVKRSLVAMLLVSVAACGVTREAFTPVTRNIEMPDGPPVEEIVTNFDEALQCLQGHLPEQVTFGVGQVVDATGRESYSDGATGRFVSQGAAEMVQSAMFRAGASVVNRRDPAILVTETQWGIRDIQRQIPVNFFISGSINSLDFIPGGGASVAIAGVGPRYRQNRILVGLDLSLTDAFTGRILASIPLQRQIFSQEVGMSVGRFFGDTLVSLDAGGQQREAVNFVLRQMLNLATFELLGQLVPDAQYQRCRQLVAPFAGRVSPGAGGSDSVIQSAMSTAARGPDAARPEATPAAAPAAAAAPTGETRNAAERSVEAQVQELSSRATVVAVQAISAAAEAMETDSAETRATKTAEAMQLARAAVQILQRAAELGLSGPEGDATAVVVQRAMEDAMAAYEALQANPGLSVEPTAAAPAAPLDTPPPAPGAPARQPINSAPTGAMPGGPGPAAATGAAAPNAPQVQVQPGGTGPGLDPTLPSGSP